MKVIELRCSVCNFKTGEISFLDSTPDSTVDAARDEIVDVRCDSHPA